MSWIRVLAAVALCTTACAGGQSVGAPPPSSAPDQPAKPEGRGTTVSAGCGEVIAAGGPLKVAGEFPAKATPDAFTGKVTVTAGPTEVVGVTSPEADVFLARDGWIVAVPLPKDLVGKQVRLGSEVFDARGSARDCATDGALAAGRYEIYARVVVTAEDGTSVEATGGPWPLELA